MGRAGWRRGRLDILASVGLELVGRGREGRKDGEREKTYWVGVWRVFDVLNGWWGGGLRVVLGV